MKAVSILSILYFLSTMPPGSRHDGKPGNPHGISQQLARLLTYPDQLKKPVRGIVMIQFRIDQYSRICQVKVHSRSDMLNFHFIREMTGRRLDPGGSPVSEVYTVKVHLNPSGQKGDDEGYPPTTGI